MKFKTLMMLFFMLTFNQHSNAQKTFDDDVNDETNQDAVPEDCGISLLVIGTVIYGISKQIKKVNNKDHLP